MRLTFPLVTTPVLSWGADPPPAGSHMGSTRRGCSRPDGKTRRERSDSTAAHTPADPRSRYRGPAARCPVCSLNYKHVLEVSGGQGEGNPHGGAGNPAAGCSGQPARAWAPTHAPRRPSQLPGTGCPGDPAEPSQRPTPAPSSAETKQPLSLRTLGKMTAFLARPGVAAAAATRRTRPPPERAPLPALPRRPERTHLPERRARLVIPG